MAIAFIRFVVFVYAVLAVPVGAAVGALACTGQACAEYLIACGQVLVIHPDGLLLRRRPFTAPADGDPARPSYFYGPARSDLRYIRQLAWGRWQDAAGGWQATVGRLWNPVSVSRALSGPIAVGLTIGLVAALPLAALLVGTVWLIQELLVGTATLGVRCTATTLRAVDSGVLFVRHIRVRCVACFERIPYPAYRCPDPDCEQIHWDIRPGRYGVWRRTCECGRRMPTLLVLGSARQLEAICPYRACRQPLAHRPGEVQEIILPIFGAKGAGKTLLMYGIVKMLRESVQLGIHVDYADPDTAGRLRDFESTLAAGSRPSATPSVLPRAYVLRLRIGRYRRILQLFDAAGELFYDSQRSAGLIYLGEANTFILVIDPLSVDAFWNGLPSGERARLVPDRSGAPHPGLAYQQTADRILEMGRQRVRRRLAIVFTRADLLGPEYGPGAGTGEEIRKWAVEGLGLASLLHEAESDFREVALFHTAAFGSDENSLTNLVHWVMRAEGLPPASSGIGRRATAESRGVTMTRMAERLIAAVRRLTSGRRGAT